MCVQQKGFAWERPAIQADFVILSRFFPEINFSDAYAAMSMNGFQPLTTDLVLLAGVLSSPTDDLGIRSVPFSGIHRRRKSVVKLVIMRDIVPWMENTALGSGMWRSVSAWTSATRKTSIEFTMNCSCIEVPNEHYQNGKWAEWTRRYNNSRKEYVGRTNIEERASIRGTDITQAQYTLWFCMRRALESLWATQAETLRVAA